MAKGDDAKMKKRNKANRKKIEKRDSKASVSTRVAAIIASKKRRKSGKRRMCEGMCFSLPTPDDPFNDMHGKQDFKGMEPKKKRSSKEDKSGLVNGKDAALRKGTQARNVTKLNQLEVDLKDEQKGSVISINDLGQKCLVDPEGKVQVIEKEGNHGQHGWAFENSNCPSKFLIMCLNSIESALRQDGTQISEEDKPLFVNAWGAEFWKFYSAGKDILETSGASSSVEQIVWMVSIAADTIARKEKEGQTFASPFFLFLVPSQEKAVKVRSICKPLKALGIHTVSIHPGASLDHQIQGLKSCEPEFFVSTPERLLELVNSKAIDISGVSLLGMCFSLPTPDDPFNDMHGKQDFKGMEPKKKRSSKEHKSGLVNGKDAALRKGKQARNVTKLNQLEEDLEDEQKGSVISVNDLGQKCLVDLEGKVQVIEKEGNHGQHGWAFENSNCPSKFLIMCLNSIESALRQDGTHISEEDKPLFVNAWGVEFWKCYSAGKDILETSGSSSSVEQIAWMVSIAADTIARKEKEGLTFASPFLLFLVPSQEKAVKVRTICKPLKALGIHTVSIHPGASLDHQIQGLKSCEPEFLVSTPERLLELVTSKAIDISGVSLLVVDGLKPLSNGSFPDMIKTIRQSILGNPLTVVFDDCFSHASVPLVQNLLLGSTYRLSLNDTITSLSSCIIQSVNVCASEEEKLSKGIQILDEVNCNKLYSQPLKVLYILGKDSKFRELATALKIKGYSISTGPSCTISNFKNSKMKPSVSIIDVDQISTANLEEYEIVIIPSFVLPIDSYVHVLTRMARHTINGMLHSFVTKENSALAGPLIEILEQCGQAVPEALRHL